MIRIITYICIVLMMKILGKCVSILKAENRKYTYPVGYVPVKSGVKLLFKVEVNRDKLQFYYTVDSEETYKKIGETFNCSFLSDAACEEGWFTGAMVGICFQDLTGFGKYADFDFLEYCVKE